MPPLSPTKGGASAEDEEPYYSMGPIAVGWHRDQSLEEDSTIAVYSYTPSISQEKPPPTKFQRENITVDEVSSLGQSYTPWRIGLKVAWDIDTPALRLPISSGDTYFMLRRMNVTHQHCVLKGTDARFSSTHRKAVVRFSLLLHGSLPTHGKVAWKGEGQLSLTLTSL